MDYIVKLTDANENTLKILLRIMPHAFLEIIDDDFFHGSSWQALYIGYIKYPSGHLTFSKDGWTFKTNLHLRVGNEWGIKLDEFFGNAGLVRQSGTGLVLQSWVTRFKPGKINWVLM